MLGVTKRSLGRLIGGKSLLSKHKSSSSNFYGFTSFNSFNSLHASPWSHSGEKAETTYYEVEDKAKAGSDSVSLKLKMKNVKKGKEVEVKEELTSIKKEDIVNLYDLLFTKNRDYLIKCNNGKRVKAEHLEGKVVAIYFGSILDRDTQHFFLGKRNEQYLTSLTHTYYDLQPKNCFEVVFVDVHDVDSGIKGKIPFTPRQGKREDCEDVFSVMPWTAIPLSDIASRIYLKQRFGIHDELYVANLFIVDSTGLILQCESWEIFRDYGAMGYPFSDERIDFLKSEDAAAARQPSLKKLLASPERDYLISNKGDKVPIHTLEDKVVALYMYINGETNETTTEELKTAYEELAKNNINFEVVLIYIYSRFSSEHCRDDEPFWNTFKTMPWLALPFRDSGYKKLKRILRSPWDCHYDEILDFTLIVIGPYMEFIEPFGLYILRTFKIPAYPFSRERVAKLLTKEYKELKLEMLWDQNSAFGKKYGSQVQFTQLVGKRVIILYGFSQKPTDFLEKLKKIYIKFKGTKEEFEVIQITYKPNGKEYYADVPWFVQLLDEYTYPIECFSRRYFYYDPPICPYYLTAFDLDGRVVRKTDNPTVESKKFPFYAGDLDTMFELNHFEEEVLKDLDTMFESNHFEACSYSKSIFAYKRNIIEFVQQWDYMISNRTYKTALPI